MQRSKKIFAAMALTILPAATFAQYPTITKEAQAKIDSMQAAWTAHSDSAWAVAFPIVKQEAMAGRLLFTPLFVTVLVIEFSDLIFAFDSIPAVFSVSLDPYVVFFSNIFAILGLRAMFFLLAAIADRFRYLKTGVCVLLLFIGVKMLIHEWVEIDAVASLCIILAVLVVSIGASLLPQRKKA